MDVDPYRLPRTVLPRRYDLELTPDLAAASFTGRVCIEVDVTAPVTELVLNAAELQIHAVTVDGVPAGHTVDEELERLTVGPVELAAGPAVLEVAFTGTLNDRLCGFYRSTFRAADGTEHVIATTQMQATDCRRAFPCWDEPDFKAVFAVTLVVAPDLLAVSNAQEVSRTARPDGRVEVRFADTMVMSSYLVAFVVGPLAVTDPVDVDGTPVRVIHVPGKEALTRFGLDAAVAGLRFFERYYGIPCPGGKIDLLAIPDFAAGAMENLGCITFRENALLVDPDTSTQAERQRVVEVVCHELAHMWFGDLVTMRWWNGIWLNEAFATFMGIDATADYRPEWDRWTNFALDRSAALEVDALSTTRTVEYEVRSPEDANGMFDVLTYEKGGALLRMLQQYIGEDRFRDGVRQYLARHAYANTETGDLWDSIEAVTGEPVRRVMDSWIWQPGFPLVRASLQGSRLVVRQERFGYSDAARDDAAVWMVPLHIRELGPDTDTTHRVLLEGDLLTIELSDPSVAVVVNAGGHGFVRTAYDATLLGRLAGHTLARLGTVDRYNLVADAWAAVVAGHLPAADFLSFVRSFADETQLAVWRAVVVGLKGCDRLVDDTARAEFAAMVRALVGPALHRLGWEPRPGEPDLTAQLRGLLVQTLAVLGEDDDVRRRCAALFDQDDHAGVEAELLAAATVVVAACGGGDRYDQLLDRARAASTPQSYLRYLYALGDLDDEALVRQACALALSGEVKSQNAPMLLARAIANRHHGAAAWRFVREHWREALDRFPPTTIRYMVQPVALLDRDSEAADVQAFFAEHDIPNARLSLAQTLERQGVNVELRRSQSDVLSTALRAGA